MCLVNQGLGLNGRQVETLLKIIRKFNGLRVFRDASMGL